MRKSLRIVSGIYKGRRLHFPSLDGLSPTKDIVKEALFNIIGISLSGKSFIDLFAGSGSVGIEAISRGSSSVYFVDRDRGCIRTIKRNLDILSVENSHIFCLDIFSFLSRFSDSIRGVDYIFCDPPYDFLYYEKLLDSVYPILSSDSVLIIEHSKATNIVSGKLCFVNRYDYGASSLSIFKRS